MCVIFIADGEDEYYAAETDEDVRSYEEVNDEKSIEASDGTKSLEMTSDEYYADDESNNNEDTEYYNDDNYYDITTTEPSSIGTKSAEMTSDEYYGEDTYLDTIGEEEKEEVVNKDPTEGVEILELEEELTIDDDGKIVEKEDFVDTEGLGDHCVLEKHSLDQNSLDQGQYYLVECKMFPK